MGAGAPGRVWALGLAGVRGPGGTPAVCWPRPELGTVRVAGARGGGPPPARQAVWQSCAYYSRCSQT